MNRFLTLQDLYKAAKSPSAALEARLTKWAKPPSESEIDKCERAVRMVKLAIEADPKLSKMNISVFAKGSFANRTNIPTDSDVDVAVVANDYMLNDYPAGTTAGNFGLIDSSYTFSEFRADVGHAITAYFGSDAVTAKPKCITVHSNSCRVDADVVPHFIHRRYSADGSYLEGVALKDSVGTTVKNWPKQDYENGVAKNEATNRQYKALVRILKCLRAEMEEQGHKVAEGIAPYLIACLVWNVPDHKFAAETNESLTVNALDYLIGQTSLDELVKDWAEVNDLKYLFRDSQPWRRKDVHAFLESAKSYLETLK